MKITKIVMVFLCCFLTSSIVFASDHEQTLNKEEQRLIRKAKHFKEIEDYQDYLQHYPNGVYADEARRGLRGEAKEQLEEKAKIDKLAKPLYDEIMKTNKSHFLFLERFPKSSYVDEVKKAHDIDLWEFTKTHNEIYLYEAYIKRSLSGIHVEEAKKIVTSMLKITKIKELEARVRSLPASDIYGNLSGYKELAILDSNNSIYQKKVAHYSSKFNETKKIHEEKIHEEKIEGEKSPLVKVYGVAKYGFEMKSSPSFSGSAVKAINKNDKITLTEKYGEWLKGSFGNKTGWIAKKWIHPQGELSQLPFGDRREIKRKLREGGRLKPWKSENSSYSYKSDEASSSDIPAVTSNKSDMRKAEKFLDSLPKACSGSYFTIRSDGTVVIMLHCKKGNDTTNGEIHIKNGVVKQIH